MIQGNYSRPYTRRHLGNSGKPSHPPSSVGRRLRGSGVNQGRGDHMKGLFLLWVHAWLKIREGGSYSGGCYYSDSCVAKENSMQPNEVEDEIRARKISSSPSGIVLVRAKAYENVLTCNNGGATVQSPRVFLCRARYGLKKTTARQFEPVRGLLFGFLAKFRLLFRGVHHSGGERRFRGGLCCLQELRRF